MSAGSAQEQWLRDDLAANPTACTLAYWHHPRFSSGEHGDNGNTAPLYQALYDSGAEIVLTGHDHDYERFSPMTAGGQADSTYGVREFVVGTGGRHLRGFSSTHANSEVRNSSTYGVLRLTLRPDGYTWEFLPVSGSSFTDSGSGSCHSAPGSASSPASTSQLAGLTGPLSMVAVERPSMRYRGRWQGFQA
jgi:acid phosphatase type 7